MAPYTASTCAVTAFVNEYLEIVNSGSQALEYTYNSLLRRGSGDSGEHIDT